MAKTKAQLKELIDQADYLSSEQKEDWFDLLEGLNQEQIDEVYNHFNESIKKERDFMLKLLIKSGMKDKYLKNVKEFTKKFVSKLIRKETIYKKQNNK